MPSEGYQDILYLIGLAFGKRNFVEVVDRIGMEKLFSKVPYGDLSADQKAGFEAAIKHPVVRQYIALWWPIYDNLRASGDISPMTPWGPDQLEA